jgi:SSS family transporter
MNVLLVGILLYIVLQLALGYVVSRSIRTEDDYLLAGRKLGYVLATFSIFATWFGAESCIGTAGAAYREGLAGVTSDPFGYAICLLLMGLFFAVPLWKMKLTTIADFFRVRFSVSTERVISALLIPTSLLWAAAQIRAFGLVLSASSELEVSVAITVAAIVVVAYTIMGGLLADAITDVVQGVVLVVGLLILLPALVQDLGGVSTAVASVAPEKLSMLSSSSGSSVYGFLQVAEAWAIPILGSMIAQEMISRVLASRSPAVAQRSTLMAGGVYLLVGLIPLSIGLLGTAAVPHLEHPEQILPMVAQQHLSTFGYVLFAGALVSAILSTVDSALLAASGILCHNVLIPLRPTMDETAKVRLQRFGVAIMGILAYVIALHAEGVYDLVKEASAFGSGAVFVVFLFGMYSKFGTARSAVSALLAGSFVWILAHYLFAFDLSFLTATLAAFVVYLVVAVLEQPAPAADVDTPL